jgi:hypothetical protein
MTFYDDKIPARQRGKPKNNSHMTLVEGQLIKSIWEMETHLGPWPREWHASLETQQTQK